MRRPFSDAPKFSLTTIQLVISARICNLIAEVRRVAKQQDHQSEVILRVNPEVTKALRTSERDIFVDLEAHFNGVVTIKSDPAIHQEQFDIALV